MDRNTIAIGIDHGWANMKTVHTVFTSGVKEITTEPALFSNVLEYKGKYFKIGGSRLSYYNNGSSVYQKISTLVSDAKNYDEEECLLFIRGFNPVLDDKYKTAMHPMFSQSADGNGNDYVHSSLEDNADKEPSFMFLNQKALEYYEGLKNKGESVYIDTIPYEDFMLLGQFEMEKRFMDLDKQEQKERFYAEEEPELAYADEIPEEADLQEEQQSDDGIGDIVIGEEAAASKEDSISYRMLHWHFTVEQKEELTVRQLKDTGYRSDWGGGRHYPCKECHGVCTSLSTAGFVNNELCIKRHCSRGNDGRIFFSADILRLLGNKKRGDMTWTFLSWGIRFWHC